MWPSGGSGSAMRSKSSTSLPGRPWTPPEDVFPDEHAPDSTPPLNQNGDSLRSVRPKRPRKLQIRATKPVHAMLESPELSATEYLPRPNAQTPTREHAVENIPARNSHPFMTDPITPNRTPWSSGLLPSKDIPQYPYTPESIRPTKSHEIRSLSPLPSMPWDTKDSCHSPMQDALLSCASNLESLIMSREPTDEQMEYLVSKFEEMAGFLTAPDSQSRQTDDHLFSDPEESSDATGLGILSEEPGNKQVNADDLALGQSYILGVGKYIESVKAHVQDLTMRMDEVRQLNSIQLDIIGELRRDLRNRTIQMENVLVKREDDEPVQEPESVKKIPVPRNTFWYAVGEALDAVGELLHEW
ncbi:hypothetical protein P171DRAFT_429732 [Karstenula rhodostoma CBS 690.94]|uniref:Uncharacterized protein n=1 Tax=Karstenula rhodostoma CBS 690.94 TaxID=1392251 RepID=A0A9P4UF20_9PLEO|nr:hypothetical protein P171DRAFT_429732 [Karstenula rhodostoma CBS 690.94]